MTAMVQPCKCRKVPVLRKGINQFSTYADERKVSKQSHQRTNDIREVSKFVVTHDCIHQTPHTEFVWMLGPFARMSGPTHRA